MKVLLVNGSPHERGCTMRALEEVARALNGEGVETEIVQIGKTPVTGCVCCNFCRKTGRCVKVDDGVNAFLEKAEKADGFVFGSPVYYAAVNGSLKAFMDRVFCSGRDVLSGKPAAAVVSSRRAGSTSAFDEINKYFTISRMPVVSADYWNEVHGSTAADVEKDEEGLHTMRVVGYQMAWLLKCIALGREAGVTPKTEGKPFTNFVR